MDSLGLYGPFLNPFSVFLQLILDGYARWICSMDMLVKRERRFLLCSLVNVGLAGSFLCEEIVDSI